MATQLVIAQSGGPTPVINASLAGLLRQARQHACFQQVFGLVHGLEGALKSDWLDLSPLTDGQLTRLERTPGAALGATRCKLDEAQYEQVLEAFRAREVRYLAYCGGNGSMWVGQHLAGMAAQAGYELAVIGVPKTIDNDLAGTDHAPGYGSAARFLALAARDTGLDLQAMETFDDVVILEAMGRDTGWLTAAATLARETDDDAPHLLYPPELVFDEARFLTDVSAVHQRLGRVFVVVAEGIRGADGQPIGQAAPDGHSADAMNRVVYSLTTGPAAHLTSLIRTRLGLQSRFLRPGIIGRASSVCVSDVDRQEAVLVGEAAARLLAEGTSGLMVTLERANTAPGYACHTAAAPLAEVVAQGEKRLPRAYLDAAGTMITPAFRDYALPLVGALPPVMMLRSQSGERLYQT